MGVTSPSSRVRARKVAVQRVADRAAFAREQARDEVVAPEEDDPPVEEEGGGE